MKLTKQHFYFGAILTAVIERNPDAQMVLLEKSDKDKSIYQIQTNHSQNCVMFFKHAQEKTNATDRWLFTFSEKDKSILNDYYKNKIPTFIYLLCRKPDLKDSEIAILKLNEFQRVIDKSNITIKIIKNKNDFYLSITKSPKGDIRFSRNRINKTFDELIDEIIKETNGYYLPCCKNCALVRR